MTDRDKTYLVFGCISAFLGIGAWFAQPPAALVLAVSAITLGVWVLWRTRRSAR